MNSDHPGDPAQLDSGAYLCSLGYLRRSITTDESDLHLDLKASVMKRLAL